MKNKLGDLNDHLFAQMERLADEKLKGEDLDKEIKRGGAMVDVADQILRGAELQVSAAKIMADHGNKNPGKGGDPMSMLSIIEGRPRLENGSAKKQ